MKLSASALLLACLSASVLLSHVQAGFCDGKSGSYCRVDGYNTISTYCQCETKSKTSKKKGKTEYETDCDNEGDTICGNGCSAPSNWRGTCLRDDQVCASVALNDVSYYDALTTTSHTLRATCPTVTAATYRTWKNREQNSDTTEQAFLQNVINGNREWSKEQLLPQFYDGAAAPVTAPAATVTPAVDATTAADVTTAGGGGDTTGASGGGGAVVQTPPAGGGRVLQEAPFVFQIPEMNQAWDDNCEANDVTQMNCLKNFPKCVNNRADSNQCEVHCLKLMGCFTQVENACLSAASADSTLCNKYADFGDGNCGNICGEHQNDYVSAGSFVAPFMTLAIVLGVAFM